MAESLKAKPDQLLRKLDQVRAEREKLEARIAQLLKSGGGAPATGEVLDINGVSVTLGETDSEDRDEIAALADRHREGKKNAVLVLFSAAGRGAVHVALTDDLVKGGKKAGDLVNKIAAVSGGKGGGRPGLASAGAGDPAKLGAARSAAPAIITEWLAGGR